MTWNHSWISNLIFLHTCIFKNKFIKLHTIVIHIIDLKISISWRSRCIKTRIILANDFKPLCYKERQNSCYPERQFRQSHLFFDRNLYWNFCNLLNEIGNLTQFRNSSWFLIGIPIEKIDRHFAYWPTQFFLV